MKKVIKSKKGDVEINNSFLFEMVLGVMVGIILVSYVNTVQTGMVYWREYYSQDLGLTMSMIEGISNDVSVNYVVLHDNSFIKTEPVRLGLKLFKGELSLFNRENPYYETTEYYITKKSSELEIEAPLEALTIRKNDQGIDVTSRKTLPCITYPIKKKEFLLTSISVAQLDDSDLTYSIHYSFEDSMKSEYAKQLSSADKESLRTALFNKNVLDPSVKKDIIILFNHEKADTKSVIIQYSSEGNMELAANLACQIYSDLREDYNYNLDVYIENVPTEVGYDFDSDTAVVLIKFRSKKSADDFFISSSIFADLLIESIQSVSLNFLDDKFLNELLENYGVKG